MCLHVLYRGCPRRRVLQGLCPRRTRVRGQPESTATCSITCSGVGEVRRKWVAHGFEQEISLYYNNVYTWAVVLKSFRWILVVEPEFHFPPRLLGTNIVGWGGYSQGTAFSYLGNTPPTRRHSGPRGGVFPRYGLFVPWEYPPHPPTFRPTGGGYSQGFAHVEHVCADSPKVLPHVVSRVRGPGRFVASGGLVDFLRGTSLRLRVGHQSLRGSSCPRGSIPVRGLVSSWIRALGRPLSLSARRLTILRAAWVRPLSLAACRIVYKPREREDEPTQLR